MSHAAAASRLSVLLLSDIVGSTEQKTRLGLSEYAKRLARHDEIFKALITQFPSAEILKDTGDGYFSSFATTSDAVRFALRFQQALHEQRWTGEPLRARVGIHVGEVAQMELEQTGKPKIVGLAADLVSRVTQLAAGGQILLTRFAFNEARQFVSLHPTRDGAPQAAAQQEAPELKWVAHGPYLFKGTDEAVEIFEVGAAGLAPLTAPPGGADARRAVAAGADELLGWRPAVGLQVPQRPQWELEKRLGEGGFGEVWLARHVKLGTHRAFKFCFDADRLRSFKRELTLFRILQDSLGDRPDIARIFEVELDAPPYFLESEYTEGGNLQDWSDMEGGIEKIPLATRLDLVARIADAVAAAHSVGVLHKDIKPSNILISLESGQPRPQLADFGIGIVDRSRMQSQQPITLSGFTLTGDDATQTGTRLYIPPEVLVGRPFTVQGDVYALGVLLYQMVVADLNRPLAEGWERDVPDELLREDISACVDGDPTRRLTSAADLSKRLRSLGHRREWMLREERERLIAARRQRVGRVAIAAALTLVVLLGVVGAVAGREWAMRRQAERLRALAEEQRHRAEEARKAEADQREIADNIGRFLMNMITSVQPDTREGRDVTMRQAIEVAVEQLESKSWHPEVEAYLRHTISQAYRGLGDPQRGEQHARRAVELIEQIKGPENEDALEFRGELAMIHYELGDLENAEKLLRSAVEGLTRVSGPEAEDTLTFKADLALVLLKMQREDEAEPMVDEMVAIRTRTKGADHEDTLRALTSQAGLLYQRGRYAEAVQAFRRIYESRQRTMGDEHPVTLLSAHNYASLLYRSGQVDEAVRILARVLEAQKRAVGPEHPRTLDAMLNLSQMLRTQGDDDSARRLLQELFEIRTRKFGPEHPDTLHAASMLGTSMATTGAAREAEPLLRQTLQLQRKLLPAQDTATLNTASALAQALEEQGKLEEAATLYRQCVEDSIRIRGEQHTSNRQPMWLLGRCLVKLNRLDEAEPVLLAGLRLAQDPVAPNASSAAAFADQLVRLYDSRDLPERAAEYRVLARQLRASTQPSTAPAAATRPATAPLETAHTEP